MFGLEKYQYADVRIESGNSLRISIRDETSVCEGISYGVSARVLKDGAWGYSSSNNIDADPTKLLIEASKLAGIERGKISLKPMVKTKTKSKLCKSVFDAGTAVELMKDASKETDFDKKVSANLSLSVSNTNWKFYNSEGSELEQNNMHCYFSTSVIARDGAISQVGAESAASLKGLNKIDMNKIASEAASRAKRLLKASIPPKGNFNTVLDPEIAGTFIHEVVGHASEADAIVSKESIYSNSFGKKVGNELVTIYDDPTLPYFGNYKYDDEGVEGKRASLITKGILTGFMNSRETATELGLAPNGHARSDSYTAPPIVRMSNTIFEPGKSKLDEVFDLKSGVYVKGSLGGSVDIFSGGFMFKAKEGYLIENGELTTPLRDVAIIGNIKEVLEGIEAVGNDFATHPGICGKGGQRAPVEDGGPHIRVKKITIG